MVFQRSNLSLGPDVRCSRTAREPHFLDGISVELREGNSRAAMVKACLAQEEQEEGRCSKTHRSLTILPS